MTAAKRAKTAATWMCEAIDALPEKSTHQEINSYINAKHGDERKTDKLLHQIFNAEALIEAQIRKIEEARELRQLAYDRSAAAELASIQSARLMEAIEEEKARMPKQGPATRH